MHAISSYRGNRATHTNTHRQDRLQYTVPQLASAQCNDTLAVMRTRRWKLASLQHVARKQNWSTIIGKSGLGKLLRWVCTLYSYSSDNRYHKHHVTSVSTRSERAQEKLEVCALCGDADPRWVCRELHFVWRAVLEDLTWNTSIMGWEDGLSYFPIEMQLVLQPPCNIVFL